MKVQIILSLFFFLSLDLFAQYSASSVNFSSDVYRGTAISAVNMNKSDSRVKVKYFASRQGNTSVYDRFLAWKSGKKIIAYSSGTYMDVCDALLAKPVGMCIDAGSLVNNVLTNEFDGFCIVYATGGMAVSNLKDKDLTITYPDKTKKTINIRNVIDRNIFIDWSYLVSATVFQTHLLAFKNELKIKPGGTGKISNRRFIAVGMDPQNNLRHVIVSTAKYMSLYDASVIAFNYLKNKSIITDLVYMINVDPGCQDVYQVYDSDGLEYDYSGFKGTYSLYSAANLLVYYYD